MVSGPTGSRTYEDTGELEFAPGGLGDLAMVAAFGVLNAPFLLRSLHGGSESARADLLSRLGLPDEALPGLGGWTADVGLLSLITDHILTEKPRTVVEFGSGASTLVAAAALDRAGVADRTFISFEQDAGFCARTRQLLAGIGLIADVRHAPLVPAEEPWPGMWYDHGTLPDQIDLLLVDGPPWSIHPFTRGSAEGAFARLRVGGTVILDDAARPGERIVAKRWRRNWPNFEFTMDKLGSKGALVGRRLR